MAFESCASPEALTEWKSEASALSRRSGVGIWYAVVELFYAGADVVIIVLASLFGGAVYHLAQTDNIGDVEIHVAVGVITALIYLIGAYHSHLYRIQELFREGRDYQQVLANWALAILVLTVILFVLKLGGEVSRGAVICFAVIGGFCLAWWRRIAKRQLRRGVESGVIRTTRVVVIGETKELALFGESDFLAMFGVDEIERVILPPSAPENGGPQPSRALVAAVEAESSGRATSAPKRSFSPFRGTTSSISNTCATSCASCRSRCIFCWTRPWPPSCRIRRSSRHPI